MINAFGGRYRLWAILVFGLLTACSGGGASDAVKGIVTVRWAPVPARAIDASGGGYRVYYSNVPGFSLASATVIDVPWPGSGRTPTETQLTLSPGTWYFRVVAYSALGGGSQSEPSAEQVITIP